MDRRTFGLGRKPDAHANRRPARRLGIEMFKLRKRLITFSGERIDAQVERGTACKCGAFRRALIAEHAR